MKRCSCGREHDAIGWLCLKLVGVQKFDEGEGLELRNCQCGSTLAIEINQPKAEAA